MPPPLPAPPAGLEAVCVLLPRWLLLVGAKLEVLGGQFEAQGVGSQRVDHVLVAFSAVLHQEWTPVGLRGADQLQALQRDTNWVYTGGAGTWRWRTQMSFSLGHVQNKAGQPGVTRSGAQLPFIVA